MEKAREMQRDLFMSFIYYSKVFDYMDHGLRWKTLQQMEISGHLIKLLTNLYTSQEATMRTKFGNTS